jgi:hypothetical protein
VHKSARFTKIDRIECKKANELCGISTILCITTIELLLLLMMMRMMMMMMMMMPFPIVVMCLGETQAHKFTLVMC